MAAARITLTDADRKALIRSDAAEFWIVRAGTVRPARRTPRGIEEHRLDAGRHVWRLLPYNAQNPTRFDTPGQAQAWADRLARAQRRAA